MGRIQPACLPFHQHLFITGASTAAGPRGSLRGFCPTCTLRLSLCAALFGGRFFLLVKRCQVESESPRGTCTNVSANSNKTLTALVKRVFQADHNALEVRLAPLADVVAHFSQVNWTEQLFRTRNIRYCSIFKFCRRKASLHTYYCPVPRRLHP